jgi:hypothetical protein
MIYTHQQKYGYDEKYYIYLNQEVHLTKYPFKTDLLTITTTYEFLLRWCLTRGCHR